MFVTSGQKQGRCFPFSSPNACICHSQLLVDTERQIRSLYALREFSFLSLKIIEIAVVKKLLTVILQEHIFVSLDRANHLFSTSRSSISSQISSLHSEHTLFRLS